jgi:hypothetical protein
VIFVVMLAFFVVMLWLGIRYAAFTWGQTTPVMQIPIGVVYLAMPIGFALLIAHCTRDGAPHGCAIGACSPTRNSMPDAVKL